MSLLYDMATRLWDNLVDRSVGPMKFRFVLQPLMATIFAVRDGYKDAQAGRTPYLWAIVFGPESSRSRVAEGVKAVSRVIVLGILMDTIYQIVFLKAFYPLEMVVVVFALAFAPYLIMRGPAARIASALINRRKPQSHRDTPHHG